MRNHAIASGCISEERGFIGLGEDDIAALTFNGYDDLELLVRLRSARFDDRRLMTAKQIYTAPAELEELIHTVFLPPPQRYRVSAAKGVGHLSIRIQIHFFSLISRPKSFPILWTLTPQQRLLLHYFLEMHEEEHRRAYGRLVTPVFAIFHHKKGSWIGFARCAMTSPTL